MTKSDKINSVAIVGAGLAGISCALALRESISNVTVFEATQQPGGRMSSRLCGEYQFDSGAQFFTVGSDAFRQQVMEWQDQWLISEWQGWLVDLQDADALSHSDGATRYIGRPLMQSFIQDMAELCDVRYETEIRKLKYLKKDSRWELFGSGRKRLGSYDAVIVAIPAPQAALLLKVEPKLAKSAASVAMSPTWTVMCVFDQSLNLGFDGAFLVDDKLSWIACDSRKTERDNNNHGKEIWVLHASPEWSEANRKLSAKKVVKKLHEAFAKATGHNIPQPVFSSTEFWLNARPVNPLNSSCLYDPELRIGACGDWCCAARVEGAYLSGIAAASQILHDV